MSENTIELKATGETIRFKKITGADGQPAIETIIHLPASGEGPPLHRHVLQSETFEAIEGRLGLKSGTETIILEPGQSFTVPANTLHRCYAEGGQPAVFKAIFSPALNIQYILTEIFESCNRKNSKDPSPFDACYILRQVPGEYYLGDVPLVVQKTVFPLTAWFGKTFRLVRAKPLQTRIS